MGVLQWRLASAGASGAATGEGPLSTQYRYNANYLFEVDEPLQGPKTILQYFRTNGDLPWIGDGFDYGAEQDSNSRCKTISPDRIDKSNWFRVKVDFEPLESEQPDKGEDENGNSQEDPLLWHDEIDVSYTQVTIPVELATFRGTNRNGINGSPMRVRALGSDGPVINSAGVPFDPGIEYEVDVKIVRITKNVAEFDGNLNNQFQGAVNNDQVVINKQPYRYRDTWGPLTARIKNISGSFQIANRIPYWKKTIEVHITPVGWRRLIVDRGLERRQLPGDIREWDANGTPIQISDGDILPGQSHHMRIKDADGYPITAPVLLDGDGAPLKPDRPAIYLEYQTYFEIPFAGINW